MDKCCNKCYHVCEAINSCPDFFLVYVPLTYEGATIKIRITNAQNVAVESTLEVFGGAVELPLDLYPKAFFNSYAGNYKIQFFDPTLNNTALPFVPTDGKTYTCIDFQLIQTITDHSDVFLNIFSNDIPEPY